MRHVILVTSCVLVASSTASADPPRYSRKPQLAIDVKLSPRTVPARPRSAPKPQPVVTADDVLRIEERAQPLRRQQEALLLKLVHDTPDSDPEKPEYLLRLAEHYAWQLRFWRLQAMAPHVGR